MIILAERKALRIEYEVNREIDARTLSNEGRRRLTALENFPSFYYVHIFNA